MNSTAANATGFDEPAELSDEIRDGLLQDLLAVSTGALHLPRPAPNVALDDVTGQVPNGEPLPQNRLRCAGSGGVPGGRDEQYNGQGCLQAEKIEHKENVCH